MIWLACCKPRSADGTIDNAGYERHLCSELWLLGQRVGKNPAPWAMLVGQRRGLREALANSLTQQANAAAVVIFPNFPRTRNAPYRALNMYVATPAPKDITQLCLGRILLWESEQGRRGCSAASIDKLKECTAEFLGALFQRAASCVVPDMVLLAMMTHAQRD